MGSKSRSKSSSSTRNTTNVTDQRSVTTNDSRDFSDRRQTTVTDNSVDRRAVLTDAQQIIDSTLITIDPSDEALKSVVLGWERSAKELLTARRFDVQAANELLSDVILAANRGQVAMTQAQIAQLETWRDSLGQVTDFAGYALASGERLVQSAGERQQSITDRILDLAAGAVGQTTREQVRLIGVALAGVALIVWVTGDRT